MGVGEGNIIQRSEGLGKGPSQVEFWERAFQAEGASQFNDSERGAYLMGSGLNKNLHVAVA